MVIFRQNIAIFGRVIAHAASSYMEAEEADEVAEASALVHHDDSHSLTLLVGEVHVQTNAWSQVAQVPTDLTPENFEQGCPVHQALAIERNPDSEFARKIFAVRCPAVSHAEGVQGCVMLLMFEVNGDAATVDPIMSMSDFTTALQADEISIVGGPSSPKPTQKPATAKQLSDFTAIGTRVRIAFGTGTPSNPLLWYGGTVDEVQDDGTVGIACDDGTEEMYTVKELQEALDAGGFDSLDAARGGIVANEAGHVAAEGFAWCTEGNQSVKKRKKVGVLLGATGWLLGGDMTYQQFIVNPAAFETDAESDHEDEGRRTRSGKTDQTQQDKKGFHTFRRGDIVVSKKEGQASANVSSLTFPPKGPKFLVLQEVASGLFFIGKYTEWQRKVKVAGSNPDDDDNVETMAAADVATMVVAQSESDALKKMTTRGKVEGASHTVSQYGPPSVEVAAKRRMAEERKNNNKKGTLQPQPRGGGRGAGQGAARGGRKKKRDRDPINLEDDADPPKRNASTDAATQALLAANEQNKDLAAKLAAMKRRLDEQAKAQQLGTPIAPQTVKAVPLLQPESSLNAPSGLYTKPRETDLPPGWKAARDSDGLVYYSNRKRGLSQYEHPNECCTSDSPPLPPPSARRPRIAQPDDRGGPSQLSPNRHAQPQLSPVPRWGDNQRRDRIAWIMGALPYIKDDDKKADLHGELATLQRQEAARFGY